MPSRRLLVLLVAGAALLAGCADKGGADAPADQDDAPDVPDACGESALCAAPETLAPTWEVGQTWKHDWTLGTAEFSTRSIVVEAAGNGYRVATDDEARAVEHASFFFHNLGSMDADWSMHQGDYVFPWYDFPLHDGKTWTAREENIDFDLGTVSRDLTMTARLVNGSGNIPAHYAIEQRTGDGGLRATYDYRPDIQWFSTLSMYDPTAPDSLPQLTLRTSAWGKGWTGTYYEATADFVLSHLALLVPTGGQVLTEPTASFTITADHTHVMAIAFAFAGGGGAHTEIVAPDGQHWETNQVADQNGATLFGNGGIQVLVPAVAGDWRVAWAGASPFVAGGGAFAWGATVTTATL